MRKYRKRNAAAIPNEDERQGEAIATEVYTELDSVNRAPFLRPEVNVRVGLAYAEQNEDLIHLCELMSEAAQAQTIAYARQSSGLGDVEWTCPKAVGLLIRRSNVNRAGGRIRAARIVSVNAKGDRATATVSYGKGVPLSTIPLVKEDGEWKLAASPTSGSQ